MPCRLMRGFHDERREEFEEALDILLLFGFLMPSERDKPRNALTLKNSCFKAECMLCP